jgi:hypothetical protein
VRRYFRELLGTFEKRMEQYRHVLHEILQLRENEPKTYTPQSTNSTRLTPHASRLTALT